MDMPIPDAFTRLAQEHSDIQFTPAPGRPVFYEEVSPPGKLMTRDELRADHEAWVARLNELNSHQYPDMTLTPSAPQILDAAAGHMRDRAATYDSPQGERSMGRAVAALNAVLGRQALTESEGWLLLQLLKDVRDRQCAKPHRDSLEDGVAYAALKAEARLQEGGAA